MPLRLGIGMMATALLVPFSVLILPFFGVIGVQLTAYALVAGTVGEGLFWAGAALAGRDAWRILRSHGWRQVPGRMLDTLRTGELAVTNASAG